MRSEASSALILALASTAEFSVCELRRGGGREAGAGLYRERPYGMDTVNVSCSLCVSAFDYTYIDYTYIDYTHTHVHVHSLL